ncbi:hypothetical protein NPIL_636251 [Nephila pilipes]|uniref:Uncharacterized protein n=1 Tax=Nephila pilipes TaxID=299642 RepID=A0A8X6QB17_NEPPI|nr:hypothetical protein NPIL_636251 [Nephila pilipes]
MPNHLIVPLVFSYNASMKRYVHTSFNGILNDPNGRFRQRIAAKWKVEEVNKFHKTDLRNSARIFPFESELASLSRRRKTCAQSNSG